MTAGPGRDLVDTHCHLADRSYADLPAVLHRARAAGVTRIVTVGSDAASNRSVLELGRRHPEVRPAFGFHPERLEMGEADLEEVVAQVEAHRGGLVAIGEIGLPWYGLDRSPDPEDLRARAAERLTVLLELARRTELSVLLHAPHGAAAEVTRLLAVRPVRAAVLHWHKADPPVTRALLDLGAFLGVTPEVLYRERARRLVQEAPLDRLLAESDGPWEYAGPFSDRPGEPSMVVDVVTAIAGVRGVPADEVAACLEANARRCFGDSL